MSSSLILKPVGSGHKWDTREDIEPLLASYDPTKVEEIHLGGNTLGVEASKALAEFIDKTTVLKIADFADIFTGRLITEIPLALTNICTALLPKTTLVELNLSDNAFGGRSVDPMVPFLTHHRGLKTLKISNNGLGPAGGTVLASALLEAGELIKREGKTSSLRTFHCGRNRLEDGSAPTWAKAFAAHATLTDVRMPQNGIRMEGVIALARGLAQCPAMHAIDLQDNTFTADGSLDGVKAWTESLTSWPLLNTLNLSDCVLSTAGEVPALIEALASGSNPEIKQLLIQNNNLESDSFSVIADGMEQGLPKLMHLEVQWNENDDDDENIEKITTSMKKRGGKIFVTDDDEDSEGEPARGEEDDEPAAAIASKSTDDLADLFNKVTIH